MIKKYFFFMSLVLKLISILVFIISCKKDEIQTDAVNISILRENTLNAQITETGLKDEIALTNKKVIFTTFIADLAYTSFIEEASKINSAKPKAVVAIGKNAFDAVKTIMPNQNIIFSTIKDDYYNNFSENSNDFGLNISGVYYIHDISKFLEISSSLTKAKSIGYIYGSDEYSLYMQNIISNICFKNNIKYVPYDFNKIDDFKLSIKHSKKPDMFVITKDNTVMENIYTITKAAYDNFIPIASTDIFSSENGGVLLAVDINYYRLGRILAGILNEFLDGKKIENIYSIYLHEDNTLNILINIDIAKHLKIKIPDFLQTNAKIITEDFNMQKSPLN